MPSVEDLSQSKYLRKEDFKSPTLVTIKGHKKVEFKKDNGQVEHGYALEFDELDKPLSLNKTNGERIAAIVRDVYGVANMYSDFDNWVGKKIELFNDPSVDFGGKLVGGIRVVYPWNPDASPNPSQPAVGNIPDDDIPF